MCLALLALDAVQGWPLILLANRDERHARPAQPLDWWPARPDIVGGRDALAGGSWLAARRDGRFATVLNDARVTPPAGAPSRGELVTTCLETGDAVTIAGRIHGRRARYAGFHLMLGAPGGGWYVGSHADRPRQLSTGIHTVGNAGLDPGGARLRKVRNLFQSRVSETVSLESLLQCLADTSDPGASPGDCRPVFIAAPDFGTRCSTVLAISDDGRARIHERRFEADGRPAGDGLVQWDLERGHGTY